MISTMTTLAPEVAQLRIDIIGAGMGGMGSACALAQRGFSDIHVWESARTMGEVGAGINITPNLSRLLNRWGVLQTAKDESVALNGASVLEGSSDTTLTAVDFSYIEEEFGSPFLVVHRSALQKCLVSGALDSGVVKLHLGHVVEDWDFDSTSFSVSARKSSIDGDKEEPVPELIRSDIILAADGVKSKARAAMMGRTGEKDDVLDTGQAAYRILIKRSQVNEDPELLSFFDGSHSYRWVGEKRHIIAYPICSHEVFNLSTAHPDRRFVEADSWTATGSKAEMLETFADFCPRVRKLLNLVPEGEVLEWKLRGHSPLASWVVGNTALVGDACHPTLPHLAQGAAQAIEDAAVLAVVLSNIRSKDEINKALRVYQALRKPRADWAVATAANNGKGLHLGKGQDRDTRDAAFRSAQSKGGSNPDKAIDKGVQSTLYSFDVVVDAEQRFDELFAQLD